MTTEFARTSLRLAAAAVIAGGLAACSTVESLDPTGMLGSDSAASDTGGIPAGDPGEQQQADQSGMGQPEAAASPDAAQPDVASIPDKPQAPTSDAENDQVASSLQADAANVQYSADSLRGGTEASAPPPGSAPAETPAPVQVAAATPPPARTSRSADVPASNVTPGTMGADAPAQPEAAPSPDSTGPLTEAPAQPAAAAPPSDAPDNTPIPEPEPVAEPDQTASAQTAAPAAEAPAQPEAAAQPEAPAQPEPAAAPAPQSVANAEAPAQPEPAASPDTSAAPAPAPEPTQVASAAPVPGAQAPVTRRAAPGFAQSTAPALDPSVSQFVSAPVIARYKQTAMLKPSVFPDYSARPGGAGPATATIMFPGDTTILDDKAKQQVRAAAELYKSQGGKGFVRIVGYASASSGNLSSARLMQINFDHSQARATTIARALMKEGVPAKKVLVDAAPQSASVAKAEIFVQG